MKFKVRPSRRFEKEAKILIKKYASFRNELLSLGKELAENPYLGTPLGKSCYKVRLAIESKGKGKSGGARVITYVVSQHTDVILLSVYDKSEKENLEQNELNDLLGDISLD